MCPVTPRSRRDALPRQLKEEGEEAGKWGGGATCRAAGEDTLFSLHPHPAAPGEVRRGRERQGISKERLFLPRFGIQRRVRSKLPSLELVGSVARGHF